MDRIGGKDNCILLDMKKVENSMYTPKEWKNTPKDWSSTLDSWICKENMFWNILHLSKSDFKRSRIINPPTPPHPLSFLGFCHGNVFDDEWPAHKSVSVKKRKKRDHMNIWKNWNAASGSESISGNERPSVCKFAEETFSLLWSITS